MSTLEYGFAVFWYVVVIASIINYAMLDGFDLGVGMLILLTKKDRDRRVFINAIGPVWDGNELWLVIVMGALFAGFPLVYSTLLSAMYSPVMVLVFALIFRAVAIEFRSKRPSALWRKFWDVSFSMASLLIALSVGIVLGNFVQGIPLNEQFQYTGKIVSTFLRPYPILVGVMTLSLFTLHGAIFLAMKTDEQLHDRVTRWAKSLLIIFLFFYVLTTVITLTFQNHIIARFNHYPLFYIIPVINVLAIAGIPYCLYHKRYGWAFLSSCSNILLLLILFASGMFPQLIRSSINPAFSLTIANTASTLKTLIVLTIIVAIGLPLVAAYMTWIYRIFRGKVVLDDHSY